MRSRHFILIVGVLLAITGGPLYFLQNVNRTTEVAVVVPQSKPEETEPTPAEPLNPDIAAVFELVETGKIEAALRSIERLSSNLTPQDNLVLVKWSTGKRPAKIDADTWFAIVNDVWNAVRRQEEPVQELIPALVALFESSETDYVLRDYSIQHLGGCLDEHPEKLSVEQKNQALEALKKAAAVHSLPLAGTALYSLQSVFPKLTEEFPTLKESLVKAAADLIKDDATNDLARISAFQIVMENRDKRSMEDARRISSGVTYPPMLRASAIATLGCLGTETDRELLKGIKEGCNDLRLLGALTPALSKLTANAVAK